MTLGLAILGSTGSIGRSTIRVVEHHPERLRVVSLAAFGRRPDELLAQTRALRPQVVAVWSEKAAHVLRRQVPPGVEVLVGAEGLQAAAVAPGVGRVVAAMVGAAGLAPVWAALEAGLDVALANKEALVVAGGLLTRLAARRGARLLPIDSEHAALHQALRGGDGHELERLVLTASGGPFRDRPLDTFADITPADALRHPTWDMGAKISIDSATMMNKGLELIEASHLFAVPAERIEVVVHPQSIVHSLVEFHDGSLLAQLSPNDMVFPIQYALAYPERWSNSFPRLSLTDLGRLEFRAVEDRRYPALGLARQALAAGESAAAVLNAANEVAVAAFLDGELPFVGIARIVASVLEAHRPTPVGTLEEALEWDRWGRVTARECAARAGGWV